MRSGKFYVNVNSRKVTAGVYSTWQTFNFSLKSVVSYLTWFLFLTINSYLCLGFDRKNNRVKINRINRMVNLPVKLTSISSLYITYSFFLHLMREMARPHAVYIVRFFGKLSFRVSRILHRWLNCGQLLTPSSFNVLQRTAHKDGLCSRSFAPTYHARAQLYTYLQSTIRWRRFCFFFLIFGNDVRFCFLFPSADAKKKK